MISVVSIVAAVGMYATPGSVEQSSQQPIAINAVQRQADRAGKDRWTRSEVAAASEVTSDEDLDSDEDAPAKANIPRRHRHELNGDLHLGDW